MVAHGTTSNEQSKIQTETNDNAGGGFSGMVSFMSNSSLVRDVSGGGTQPDPERRMSADQLEKVNSGNMCAICLDDMDEENGEIFTIPACKHKFHEPCVRLWKKEKATCPSCRGVMPETLGLTNEHVWLGNRQLTINVRAPPEPTPCHIISTIVLAPFGIVYSLLMVITFTVLELLLFVLLIFFFLGFSQWYACWKAEEHWCGKICLCVTSILLFPFVVLGILLIWISHLRILFYYLGKFYEKVVTCKARWRDAFSEIVLTAMRSVQEAIQTLMNENDIELE